MSKLRLLSIVAIAAVVLVSTARSSQEMESAEVATEIRKLRESMETLLTGYQRSIVTVERLRMQLQRVAVLQERASREQKDLDQVSQEIRQQEGYLAELEHQIGSTMDPGHRATLEQQKKTVSASLAVHRQTKSELELQTGAMRRQIEREEANAYTLDKALTAPPK